VTEELIARREGVAGFLTLNRPKAIHALTTEMDHAMTEALLAWREDAAVKVIIIDHSEGRGFCAGGDVAFLRQSALTDNGVSGRKFFFEEYRLNHMMFTYPKPMVAFMDGITMGGGVGISQPAKYRVATENTRYAMPETGIGLFPDVGGGWFLAYCEALTKRSAAGLATMKTLVNRGLEMNLDASLQLEMDLACPALMSADVREGTSAFLEKREPRFK